MSDDIIKRLREAIAAPALHDEGASSDDTWQAVRKFRQLASPDNIADLLDRLAAAELSVDWYRKRCDMLQQWQAKMRDPERTIVCDILANGATLPDQNGRRYGSSAIDAAEKGKE